MYLLLAGGIAMSVLGLVPQLRRGFAGCILFTILGIRMKELQIKAGQRIVRQQAIACKRSTHGLQKPRKDCNMLHSSGFGGVGLKALSLSGIGHLPSKFTKWLP